MKKTAGFNLQDMIEITYFGASAASLKRFQLFFALEVFRASDVVSAMAVI